MAEDAYSEIVLVVIVFIVHGFGDLPSCTSDIEQAFEAIPPR